VTDRILDISDSFALSVDFVTWTQAILAKKGSGKSYTASVEAEELLELGQQVVVIDPTGAWWGLRSSADGKDKGFPIAVLGGEHGDVPLEPLAGEVIADAIATEHFSAIIDLSLFRKGEALRFMVAFLETLYRKNRDALHLFVDEADVVAPQKPFGPDEAKVLGAMEDIVRRGRIRGIGCTLITQRPQVLNKNVLSQVDMLTALRMNHPKDLGAIDEWVAVHGDVAAAKRMMASLPSLPIGDAWVWAPAQDLFERITIRRRRTFDSGRTPKAGERTVAPKVLAPVDIKRLGATIASTVERVKQDDPKVLRARVAELEKDITRLKAAAMERPNVKIERQVVEVPVLKDPQLGSLDRLVREAREDLGRAERTIEQLGVVIKDIEATIHLAGQLPPGPMNGIRPRGMSFDELPIDAQHAVERSLKRPAPIAGAGPGDSSLAGGERKILTALAQYPAGRTKQQVAILTGYAHNGGGFSNYIGSLRSKGYVEGDSSRLQITTAGVKALGAYQPLPSGRALFEHWLGHLGKAEREILRALYEDWPTARPKEYVAVRAGYAADGGGFNNALSRLRTLELIEGKAKLKASDQLQDGAT
jgi:hypothetical protein